MGMLRGESGHAVSYCYLISSTTYHDILFISYKYRLIYVFMHIELQLKYFKLLLLIL